VSPAAETLARATGDRRRPLLVCYLPVGDPEATAATAAVYTDHGVDVVEAGLPVPLPRMDGPEVTASMQRALAAGAGGQAGADLLADQLATAGGPAAVWMSYRADPDEAYLEMVAGSGVGGALLLDAEPVELARETRGRGLHAVPFLDHEPTDAQVAGALDAGSYVMVAAASGVTGERDTVSSDNAALLAGLRARGVTAPLVLGFGISHGDHARAARDAGADGVVVGSACLRAARAGRSELSRLLDDLRGGLDG